MSKEKTYSDSEFGQVIPATPVVRLRSRVFCTTGCAGMSPLAYPVFNDHFNASGIILGLGALESDRSQYSRVLYRPTLTPLA
jgi:hypothetical protein